MRPDDERLSDFDDELENSIEHDEDSDLYGAPSSHRLADALYDAPSAGSHNAPKSSRNALNEDCAALPETPAVKLSRHEHSTAVRAHVEKYIGAPQPLFSADDTFTPSSEYSNIEILHVAPTPSRPFHTLVTCGMGDRPMSAPGEEIRYAELVVTLPADWPISELDDFDGDYNWPLQWLQILAQLPHEHDTWLGRGHTVPNGEPAEAFAENTEQCCMILLPPLSIAREFRHLQAEIDGEEKIINFYAMVPIYKEEMEMKLKHGSDELVKLFRKHSISDVVDPVRRNACKKHRWWF
jgi:hypothetical protein